MKKAYSIIAAIALLATSCVSEPAPEGIGYEHGGKVTFTYTPDFGTDGPATRALAENPDVKNIYFAVFDAAGYKLSEYAEAVPNTYATTNEPDLYSYSVELTVTDQPRIIHIIANAPEHLSYGSEAEVIGSLCTYSNAAESGDYDRQDAYWDRIYLPNGVWAKPEEDLKTSKPEEYEVQKTKYDNVVTILNGAKLVRNFTKINVVNHSDDFVLTGFYITNVPDRGSIAPYNRNTGSFQTNYREFSTIDAMRAEDGGNYQGFTPANVNILSIDGMSDSELAAQRISVAADKQEEGASTYCYEREVAKEKPLYIIVAGRYNGHSESYYKIDLRDNDNNYFPILRNFTYRINIKSVSRDGASTVLGSLSAAPSGDIDTSIDLEDLTNISDGKSQIFVSETSEVLVGNDPVHIKYMYIPNLTTGTVVNTTLDQWAADGHDAIAEHLSYVTISTAEGETGAVFTGNPVVKAADETDKFRDVTLQPVAPDAVIKTEVVTIEGHYWTGSEWSVMTRTVTFHLREKLDMEVVCVPTKVPAGLEEKIRVDVKLGPGLPSSIFSLDMVFEALDLSVAADNKVTQGLPVSTGASTIPANTKPAYCFTRTITWTEYESAPVVDGKKVFSAYFKTNKVVSSDQIYVSNKYFNQQNVTYTTFDAKSFSALTYKESGATVTQCELGDDLTFSFSMSEVPSDNKVKVYMFGLESADSGLTFIGSDEEGYEIYEMTVNSTTASFSLSPYSVGTATIKLEADEFRTSEKNINAVLPGSTNYSLETGSIDVFRINTSNRFGNGTTVSYYYSDPKSGHVHAAGSFTLNNNNRNSSNVTIPAVPGSTIYFSAVYNDETYYGSANIDDLNSATTSSRYNLILNTYPPKRIIEASSLYIYRINSSLNFGNGTTVTYYNSDPQSGSPDPLGTFTVANNNQNVEFEIPYDLTGTMYFKINYNSKDYYASATVSAVDDATTGSKCSLIFNTVPPIRLIEEGSLNIYRINTSNNFGGTNTISYYFSDPKLGSVDPAGTFTTYRSGSYGSYVYRNNDFEIPFDASGTIYFTATYNSKTYYAEASVSDIDNATSSGRYNLIFQTDPPTWTIEANSVNIYRFSTSNKVANNTTINYYYSDPRLGSVTSAGNFKVNNNNRNNEFSPEVASGSTIYFSYTADSKTYYAEAAINQLDNATNDNSNRWNLIFDTYPPHEKPSMYADAAHTDASAINLVSSLTGADVTESGQLVVGQTGKLTVYVSESAASIQIGTLTANRVTSGTGATISKDGKTYYAYTTNNNYTAASGSGTGGSGYNNLDVTFDGETIGSVSVPVWGVNISNTSIEDGAPDTDTWYVFYNYGRSRWVYNSGSTLALNNSTPGYNALMKFSSAGTTTTVFNAMANNYVIGTTGNFSFGGTGTTYTRSADSDRMRLSYTSYGNQYYWYGDSTSAVKMSNSNYSTNRRNFDVYPVTFVNPAL